MPMTEEITKDDIKKLGELNDQFVKWLNKNKHTAKLLKMRNKFAGTLGEAKALIKLYDIFKKNNPNWKGFNKRGADIVIKTTKKEIKIQIKTTTTGENVQLFVSKIKNGKTLRNRKLSSGDKKKIIEEVANEVKGKADYWIVVDIHRNKPNFFVLTEKQIINLLKKLHKKYMAEKHKNSRYHYGITKNGTIRHVIEIKNLRKYKEKWKVLGKIR